MYKVKYVVGLGALALMVTLSLRHAHNNYGILDGNLPLQVLAQTNNSGGGTTGDGGGTTGDGGGTTGDGGTTDNGGGTTGNGGGTTGDGSDSSDSDISGKKKDDNSKKMQQDDVDCPMWKWYCQSTNKYMYTSDNECPGTGWISSGTATGKSTVCFGTGNGCTPVSCKMPS